MSPQSVAGVMDAGASGEAEALLPRGSAKLAPNSSSMLDPDYMAMMLAMDTLWASEEVVAHPTPGAGDAPASGAA